MFGGGRLPPARGIRGGGSGSVRQGESETTVKFCTNKDGWQYNSSTVVILKLIAHTHTIMYMSQLYRGITHACCSERSGILNRWWTHTYLHTHTHTHTPCMHASTHAHMHTHTHTHTQHTYMHPSLHTHPPTHPYTHTHTHTHTHTNLQSCIPDLQSLADTTSVQEVCLLQMDSTTFEYFQMG